MATSIHQEVTFKATPRRVYRAFMNSKAHEAFTANGKARGGTRLVFDQTGMPPEHVGHLSSGWKARYWQPLKKYLEQN
jgi:uncharacterized protein YndB with AHSA1/START domain